MRPRLPLALTVAWLAVGPARADVLSASSTTLGYAFPLYLPGQSTKAAFPVFELVSVSASEMRTGWGEFEATLSAWGSADLGTVRRWQGGAPNDGGRVTGDVDVGYLRGVLLGRRLTIRLGRQIVVEGNARMLHLDGGQLLLRLPAGFGLSTYVGAPVYPRFEERGGLPATGNARADLAYGGRVSWGHPGLLEVGASVALADDGSEVSRRDAGADLRFTPHRVIELAGSGFYSLYEERLGEAEVAARLHPVRWVTVMADYRHVEPDLYLPRDSILAAFAAAKREEYGGGLHLAPHRMVDVDAGYHYLKEEGGDGHDLRLKGVLRLWTASMVGAEARYLKVPENGYTLGRLFGSREWGRLSATLDAWLYAYQNPVNGVDQSVGGTATAGWQLAPAWRVLLAGTAGSDPFFKSRLEVMAKLVWNQLFVREVRR